MQELIDGESPRPCFAFLILIPMGMAHNSAFCQSIVTMELAQENLLGRFILFANPTPKFNFIYEQKSPSCILEIILNTVQ